MSASWKMRCLRTAFAFAAALAFSSCAKSRPGKDNTYYAVSAAQAQLYRFGPAQPMGADLMLKKGDRIIMLRQEYGFSRVITEEGTTGYIANDFIAPAPPPEKPRTIPASALAWANLPPLPSRGTSVPGVSSANRAILQSDPLFGGDRLPPLPDEAKNQKPKPGFRFNVHGPTPANEGPQP